MATKKIYEKLVPVGTALIGVIVGAIFVYIDTYNAIDMKGLGILVLISSLFYAVYKTR